MLGGRWLACAVLVAGGIALALLLNARGWKSGWRAWGIATQTTPWLDVRVITAAVATAAEGGNPYLANPHDPTGRTFNYPSLWLRLFPARLSERGYTVTALSFAAAAIGALLLWLGPISPARGIALGLLLLSPALLLGLERANTDLVIFALMTLSLVALRAQARGSALLGLTGLLLATLLKLYPVVALGWIALLGPRTVRKPAWAALLGAIGWLAFQRGEVRAAIANTQIGAIHSYGHATLPFWLQLQGNVRGWTLDRGLLEQVSLLAALATLGWTIWRGARRQRSLRAPRTAANWAFLGGLTGVSIFVLTFLAGSNFHYRLWFLLLGLPWLFSRASSGDAEANAARLALGSFAVMAFASGAWWIPLTWLSLAAGWVCFAACGYLLGTMVGDIVEGLRHPANFAAHKAG